MFQVFKIVECKTVKWFGNRINSNELRLKNNQNDRFQLKQTLEKI